MTLDVSAGELFVPTGNPWPDIDKAYRPGANLFTDSIVVLDARTGALKWWHQGTPEDWMDLDMVAPPVLYRIDGARDYLVFGGKDGYVTAVDRDTHQQVFRVPVTTIERMPKMPTKEGLRMCPGLRRRGRMERPGFRSPQSFTGDRGGGRVLHRQTRQGGLHPGCPELRRHRRAGRAYHRLDHLHRQR